MRKLTVSALQFSFKDKVNWNIKPMIRMKKVSFRHGEKKVSEFYGELVQFENMGLWLMLPAQEVVSFVNIENRKSTNAYEQLIIATDGNLEWLEKNQVEEAGKRMRLEAASKGIEIKEADFFLGKCEVELYNPLKLQGCTAVLVQFNAVE